MDKEKLQSGDIICKLTSDEVGGMKDVCVHIESIDQLIEKLLVKRAFLCEKKTDLWEDLIDRYLLIRGQAYNIKWKTRELVKL